MQRDLRNAKIRQRYEWGNASTRQLGREFGITYGAVSNIINPPPPSNVWIIRRAEAFAALDACPYAHTMGDHKLACRLGITAHLVKSWRLHRGGRST